jgi:hypothetical protein
MQHCTEAREHNYTAACVPMKPVKLLECRVMPLNKSRIRMRLLRRLARVRGLKLLLQLCEEVLAGGHEV